MSDPTNIHYVFVCQGKNCLGKGSRELLHQIRENLARMLGVEAASVSVKAKTAEGVGPVGEGLAAEAHAAATVRRRADDAG